MSKTMSPESEVRHHKNMKNHQKPSRCIELGSFAIFQMSRMFCKRTPTTIQSNLTHHPIPPHLLLMECIGSIHHLGFWIRGWIREQGTSRGWSGNSMGFSCSQEFSRITIYIYIYIYICVYKYTGIPYMYIVSITMYNCIKSSTNRPFEHCSDSNSSRV